MFRLLRAYGSGYLGMGLRDFSVSGVGYPVLAESYTQDMFATRLGHWVLYVWCLSVFITLNEGFRK